MHEITLSDKQFTPSKIVCVGQNYIGHIKELKNEVPSELVFFIKPNSAISNTIYSNDIDAIHYEAELSFLIQDGSLSAVSFGLDLTKRDIQTTLKAKGLPWERSKAFDASAVFSEFVALDKPIEDLSLELYINDELIQHAKYELMLIKPDKALEEISRFITFNDGDLLMTGTPKGVGKVNKGDTFLGKVLNNNKILIENTWTVK